MNRDTLAKQIHQRSHLEGSFTLRSGVTASEYFDKYLFESDPELLRQIARELVAAVPEGVDALAGLELGGVPIAVMLSQLTGIPTLFVRKAAKPYGTAKLAEGGELSGRRLLVVEDVVTSGGQIIESVRELRERGAQVDQAVCVIDRQSGGGENLAEIGVGLSALFTMSQLNASAGDSANP